MTARPSISTGTDRAELAGAWCLRLAEGELQAEERVAFDAWLAADPANSQAFEAATRIWQALDDARLSPELIALRGSALETFRRGHAARWRRGNRGVRGFAAVAACLIIVAVAAGLWAHFVPRTYETGRGERRVLTLDDGSRISLDAASKVRVRYGSGRREFWLERGRAKFAVARDPLRPFSVAAASKVVVATGTEFSVELLSNHVRVILYDGSVEVLAQQPGNVLLPLRVADSAGSVQNAHAGEALLPGSELISDVATSVAQIQSIDPVRSSSWEAGQLAFTNEPLASAVERVNRYADSPLGIGDASAGQLRISGVFSAGDSDAFIEGITSIFPVKITEIDGRKSFVSAR